MYCLAVLLLYGIAVQALSKPNFAIQSRTTFGGAWRGGGREYGKPQGRKEAARINAPDEAREARWQQR